jgi:NADPH:quinone reductase-like Zn-dependent oxidoreductase
MATMRAVRLHAFGGPDVLKIEETPRPEPKSGEVLIRVHGAGVNPVDWKIREGYTNHKLPLVPGWDVAGVIEKVGPGVTSLKPKDEVYGYFDLSRNGAYADYVAVPAEEVALKPKSLDFTKAAAVPLAALTAWQGLFDVGGLKPGQKVLIHAAAGGVGSFAVQFAKWKGAHVIGTASGRNVQFVRELGADEVIDYTKTAFEEAVDNVDLVFDTMGGETQKRSWQVLKKGGILVSILGQPPQKDADAWGVRQASFVVKPDAAELGQIADLIDSGDVKPVVETVLPLSDARKAQELSQTGHTRGKIVLEVA